MATSNVGAKRSLFKKPAWASTSLKATGDNVQIFGQSHLYEDILEAERKRREKHAAKQKERAAQQETKSTDRAAKRRRISKEADDTEEGDDSDVESVRSGGTQSNGSRRSESPTEPVVEGDERPAPQQADGQVAARLDRTNRPRTRSKRAAEVDNRDTIVLDGASESDEGDSTARPREDTIVYTSPARTATDRKHKPKPPESESESEEEDEYIRKLKMEAREKARSERLGMNVKNTSFTNTTPQPSLTNLSPQAFGSASPSNPSAATQADPALTEESEEPEVKIWIKTIIPGARELIVSRKVNQSLDKVREFWIKRNELEPAIAAKVFFTWNGTRLYNSTTMRGIIERLKRSHPTTDGSDPSNGQIMIEAVTEEIFQYRENQRNQKRVQIERDRDDNQRDKDNDQNPDNQESTNAATSVPSEQQQQQSIIITLKAQGHEELKMRVRLNTAMHKIITGFCTKRQVDTTGKQCWLSYDGDRLDNEATVEEAGFEHDDSVEVYFR